MRQLITTLVLLFVTPLAFTQTSATTFAKIAEVYGNDYSEMYPDAYQFLTRTLETRVELEYVQNIQADKYTPISQLTLNTKYNPLLSAYDPSQFSVENFNPLKFMINFTRTDIDQFYWIDNTNYLLIIRRQ